MSRVCHFKLVLLGDTAVGKSCLVVRFVRDEFFEFQEPTIGGELKSSCFIYRACCNIIPFHISLCGRYSNGLYVLYCWMMELSIGSPFFFE